MNKKDFFEDAEKDMKENTSSLADRLVTFSNKLKYLNQGEKLDWSQGEEYKKIIDFVGEYPPIKLLEDVLSYYKSKRQDLITKDIPDLMREVGVNKITTTDGVNIKIDSKVTLKVIDPERLGKWQRAHGDADLLKDTIVFPKGEIDDAYLNDLISQGYSFKHTSGTHPSTLKANIKRRVENGDELPPDDILEIKLFDVAKVEL
jgi:hypothetical protein